MTDAAKTDRGDSGKNQHPPSGRGSNLKSQEWTMPTEANQQHQNHDQRLGDKGEEEAIVGDLNPKTCGTTTTTTTQNRDQKGPAPQKRRRRAIIARTYRRHLLEDEEPHARHVDAEDINYRQAHADKADEHVLPHLPVALANQTRQRRSSQFKVGHEDKFLDRSYARERTRHSFFFCFVIISTTFHTARTYHVYLPSRARIDAREIFKFRTEIVSGVC